MAFPTISDADTQSGTVTTNSTSWSLTYPTNLVAGDLIVFALAVDGGTDVSGGAETFSAFWDGTGSAVRWMILAKYSDGDDSGSFTATLSASEQGAWRGWRITGMWPNGLPSSTPITSGAQANGTGVAIRSNAGTSSTPDPGSANPTNWDVEDTLWIVVMAADTSRTVSDWPDSTTDNSSSVSGGSNGATLAWCRTELTAASWDPTTFTISASDDWATAVIAIRPAPPTNPPRRHPMTQLLSH